MIEAWPAPVSYTHLDVYKRQLLHEAHLDDRLRLTATVDPDAVTDAMAALVAFGMTRLSVTPASLEDLFLRQYDDPTRAAAERSA